MEEDSYKIRKTIIEKRISVFLNDSLGDVLEFDDFEEVSKMCEILNVNSDSNCRYKVHHIKPQDPLENTEEASNRRMNIIGQNGNEGLHYGDVHPCQCKGWKHTCGLEREDTEDMDVWEENR